MLQTKKLSVDFCVVGGGISGMLAAIAAARHGAKVALVHERPVLGGNASSEIRMWISGASGRNNRETGILEEIALENFYRNPTKNYAIWDTVLYDFVKREENITLLLNATCMDAVSVQGEFEHGRKVKIQSVKAYQMTTQTFWEISADLFADCSGDSILAPLVGAKFRLGREAAGEFGEDVDREVADTMTMGMSCLIQARETHEKVSFTAPEFATRFSEEDLKNRPLKGTRGVGQNYWYLELGGDRDTIHDTEEIRDDLVALAVGAWNQIKNGGDEDVENFDLEFLGFLPGKRESRRMEGEYIVTQKDISGEKIFEDTVAYGGWSLDDHFPGGFYHKGVANTNFSTPSPYCLPYRALYSKNVDNLFFAGRNISMTHTAMSSIRVMATCGLLGQAVGTAAALAVKYATTPHGIYLDHIKELQSDLMEDDCFLPHFSREISELCRQTPLVIGENTSEELADLQNGQDRANRIYGTETCGVKVPHGEKLTYRFAQPVSLHGIHIVFDSDLNRDTLPGNTVERGRSMRANILLDSPQMYVPTTLCKEFVVEAETAEGLKELLHVTNNRKRAYHLTVPEALQGKILGISLKPMADWGTGDATTVVSFDFK